uniref:Uncharacterized protein n=1 Tax=Setaria viridis TaxID=4556 RepID=A0A4U6TSR0_SETVI|nr:hypothetical protein SEVIR_7G204600v2 [Setaria viridis]
MRGGPRAGRRPAPPALGLKPPPPRPRSSSSSRSRSCCASARTTDSKSPAHITLTHSPPTPRANPSPSRAPHRRDFSVFQAARAATTASPSTTFPGTPAPKNRPDRLLFNLFSTW